MKYFPNIDKLKSIADILQYDTSNAKSKLEYVIHTYLLEDYKVFDNNKDYWMTSTEAKEYGLVDEVLIMNPRKLKKD